MVIKSCPPEKIRNPKTNRCVLRTGKIGRTIFNKKTSSSISSPSILEKKIKKECPPEKIMNPKTKRCVLKTGKIGKTLINYEIDEDREDKDRNRNRNINIRNENNSCYLDSLLVSLFHFKNKEIYDIFFNSEMNYFNNEEMKKLGLLIKKELLNIYTYIRKSEKEEMYCSRFRELLQKYYDIYKEKYPKERILFNSRDNWTRKQIDIYELLNFLSIIFNFKSKRMIKIIEGDNKLYSNFIIEIPSYELMGKREFKISEVIPIKKERYELDDENKYRNSRGELVSYYEKKKEYIKSKSFIYIQLYRNIGSEKLKTRIEYPEEIKLRENSKSMRIKSLIIHIGDTVNSGHYISIIKDGDKWYRYNDMESEIKEIGDKDRKRYKKNIVGLIYSL
jgi:hypothetical protein